MMKHCFAICAYKESRYLEECIESLKAQAGEPVIIMCTSTPNSHISELARKHDILLFVRKGASSLKDDWNFAVETAVSQCGAELVTIAHQDDVYDREYLKTLTEAYEAYPDMSVFCTRYRTIDENGRTVVLRAESVKRILRLPLRLRCLSGTRLVKRLPLMLGNGIGCPTCTYNTMLTGIPLFRNSYSFVIDWDTLIRLSELPGRFICAERELVSYRVHSGAETMKNIENHTREREETEMFGRMWPGFITSIIMHFYKKAYKDYDAPAD